MSENKGCGCGKELDHDHDHEHEDGVEYIYLDLADGRELACQVVGTFPLGEKEFIALLPDGEEDVYLYEYAEDGSEEPSITRIDDDDEYERVSKEFMRLVEEM